MLMSHGPWYHISTIVHMPKYFNLHCKLNSQWGAARTYVNSFSHFVSSQYFSLQC